ncbi:MAG: hypothetical protein LBR54_03800 [Oscillospiraceae bacterium]|jgi:phosphoenolpyruvate synthase/pyruvate phosphate dikinase|nr:hypothetical protein [Oscillospiraceae bacterium]
MYSFNELTNLINRAELFGEKTDWTVSLCNYGVNVPNGYVISVKCFADFLKHNGISTDSVPYNIVDLIMNGKLQPQLDEEMTAFIKGGLWAVRTSGLHSGPGKGTLKFEYKSFFGLGDCEEVKEAVKRCWCAAYDKNIVSYYRYNRMRVKHAEMSVIVQKMINPEITGTACGMSALGDRVIAVETDGTEGYYDWYNGVITGLDLQADMVREISDNLLKIQSARGRPVSVRWAYANDVLYILSADFAQPDVRCPETGGLVTGDCRKAFVIDWNKRMLNRFFSQFPSPKKAVLTDSEIYCSRLYAGQSDLPKITRYQIRKELSLYEKKKAAAQRRLERLDLINLNGMDIQGLTDLLTSVSEGDFYEMQYLYYSYTVMSMVVYGAFKDGDTVNTGNSAFPYIQAVKDLWNVSRKLRGKENVTVYDENIPEIIGKYKYYSLYEQDPSYPNCDEKPGMLLETVKIFTALDDRAYSRGHVPKMHLEKYSKQSRLLHEVLKCCGELWELSEKYCFVLRKFTEKLGEELYSKGLLDEKDGIYHLTAGDLHDGENLKEKAEKNKLYYSCFRNFEPGRIQPKARSDGENVLKGIPASGGTAEGKAKIIKDIADIYRLEQGDVLITSYTAPVWTANLLLAGGIITEKGSPICHTAIAAREFGIPCAVAVIGAMSEIKEGSTVTVCGDTGEIKF